VRQPLRESGRIGAQLLLGALDGDGRAPIALHDLTVVERRTVAPVA
jgi:DNA-binding LacI/PurR family transcriptional regulator